MKRLNVTNALVNRDYWHVKLSNYGDVVHKPYAVAKKRQVFKTSTPNASNPIYHVEFNKHNNLIGIADEAGALTIANIYRKKEYTRLCQDEGSRVTPVLYTLKWSADDSHVATGYGDGGLRIWDVSQLKATVAICPFSSSIKRVDWRDQDTLVCCSRSNEIGVFDFRMRNSLSNMINCNGLSCKLSDMCVLSEHYVASCSSNNNKIMVWDLRNTYKLYKKVHPVFAVNFNDNSVVCLGVDRDEPKMVVALGANKTVQGFHWGSLESIFCVNAQCSVDFFSKVGVDCRGFVVVGGAGACANVVSFDNRVVKVVGEEEEDFKENFNARSCSAVCLWNRAHAFDMNVKIGTGGDDSVVHVWE